MNPTPLLQIAMDYISSLPTEEGHSRADHWVFSYERGFAEKSKEMCFDE